MAANRLRSSFPVITSASLLEFAYPDTALNTLLGFKAYRPPCPLSSSQQPKKQQSALTPSLIRVFISAHLLRSHVPSNSIAHQMSLMSPFTRLYHSAMHIHPHRFYGRHPSRLNWFLIGSGTTVLFMKAHAKAHFDHERGWGRCRRVSVEGMSANANAGAHANPNASANGPSTAFQRGARYPLPQPSSMTFAPSMPAGQAGVVAPPSPPPFNPLKAYEGWEKQQDERIEAEKAHVAKVSRQAVDTMVELTEATLESVLTTAEALKTKLAEHRAERERQQKLLDEQIEAQRRDPPRSV